VPAYVRQLGVAQHIDVPVANAKLLPPGVLGLGRRGGAGPRRPSPRPVWPPAWGGGGGGAVADTGLAAAPAPWRGSGGEGGGRPRRAPVHAPGCSTKASVHHSALTQTPPGSQAMGVPSLTARARRAWNSRWLAIAWPRSCACVSCCRALTTTPASRSRLAQPPPAVAARQEVGPSSIGGEGRGGGGGTGGRRRARPRIQARVPGAPLCRGAAHPSGAEPRRRKYLPAHTVILAGILAGRAGARGENRAAWPARAAEGRTDGDRGAARQCFRVS
jgi:hypothetical protein